MDTNVVCPKCGSHYAYQDRQLWICPECAHEWNGTKTVEEGAQQEEAVLDANGNRLVTGDTVALIKDLKVKGSSSAIKGGTKVKNIRLVEAVDGHNIACRLEGIGSLFLKSEFVRKV